MSEADGARTEQACGERRRIRPRLAERHELVEGTDAETDGRVIVRDATVSSCGGPVERLDLVREDGRRSFETEA